MQIYSNLSAVWLFFFRTLDSQGYKNDVVFLL